MDFKRSFWGYSPVQVEQLITERSEAFQQKKSQLENELISIHQSGQKLNQILEQLRNKCELAYKQQQLIESSRPISEQLLQKLQEYTAGQAQSSSLENAALLEEIAAKTAQIEADQAKLARFWQTLHNKLGDLLSTMELEESAGKSLVDKYALNQDAPQMKAVQAAPAASADYPVENLLMDANPVQESFGSANHDIIIQLPADQLEEPQQQAFPDENTAAAEPAIPDEGEPPAAVQVEALIAPSTADESTILSQIVQAEDQNQSVNTERIWSIAPREDQPGMELLAGNLNEKHDANRVLSIIPEEDQLQANYETAGKNEAPEKEDDLWKAVMPDFSSAPESPEKPEQNFMPTSKEMNEDNQDASTVFNPFNTINPDASLVFDTFKTSQEPSAGIPENTEQQPAAVEQSLPGVENINRKAEPQQTAMPAALPKLQALVLDHDATILAMLRIILQRDGFTITECMDGYQAGQNIDYMEPPLLAILEANAPIVNALQLIRKIRSKPGWEECAIIVLTENTNEQAINELLAAGANDYINKPVNTRELVTRMRRLTGISEVAL